MLTIEGLISVLGLCLTCFGLGYNFFVQQIDFSSRNIYNWMKNNGVGRKEIT